MSFLSKAWAWIKHNIKLVLFIIFFILMSILVISWGSKNKKIRELERQLAISHAKLKVERLTIKYDTTIKELNKLREQDKQIEEAINAIGTSLENKLKEDMTAEEIVEKFREIGILPEEQS